MNVRLDLLIILQQSIPLPVLPTGEAYDMPLKSMNTDVEGIKLKTF